MTLSLNVIATDSLAADAPTRAARKPSWLKMKMPSGDGYVALKQMVAEKRLHTVCESAKCPNIGECWSAGTATLMILGDVCTRSCGFCHIKPRAGPTELDLDEPQTRGRCRCSS